MTGAGYVEGVAIADGAIYWTDCRHQPHRARDAQRRRQRQHRHQQRPDRQRRRRHRLRRRPPLLGELHRRQPRPRARRAPTARLSGVDQSFITGATDPAGVVGARLATSSWTNMNSSQPLMGSLSRAHLAADGSVDSVQPRARLRRRRASSASRSTPRVDRDPPVVTMTPTAPSSGSWFNAGNSGTDGVKVDVVGQRPERRQARCRAPTTARRSWPTRAARPGTSRSATACTTSPAPRPTAHRRANSGAAPGSTAFPVTLSVDQTRAVDLAAGSAPADWVAFNVVLRLLGERRRRRASPIRADASFLLVDVGRRRAARTPTRRPTRTTSATWPATPRHPPVRCTAKVDLAPPTITCPAPPVLDLGGPRHAARRHGHRRRAPGPASPTATGQTSTAVAGPQTTT